MIPSIYNNSKVYARWYRICFIINAEEGNMPLRIFEGNLADETHKNDFIRLLNEYIDDKMGGGMLINGKKSTVLTDDLVNFPTFRLIFAELEGETVGMAACFNGYSTFNVKPLINIHDIIVSKHHRNKGIGRSMIEFIIKLAEKGGCCKVTLEVRTDNENAKHLYKSLGFNEAQPPMLFWNKKII
jgi:ribosomal protein S18 acetylase RimI-like enzyme